MNIVISEILVLVPILLSSMVLGYVLGALPLADVVSRWHGVDIFSTGSGLAGASNVRRSVGKWSALLVLLGDTSKGMLVVVVAGHLGVKGTLILLPIVAAVFGHWRSVFSGFRGGDALAILGGTLLALFGAAGVVSLIVAILIALGGQRMPYSSLFSVVFGYATLVALTIVNSGDTLLVLEFGGISSLVLAHALLGHHKRRVSNLEVGESG